MCSSDLILMVSQIRTGIVLPAAVPALGRCGTCLLMTIETVGICGCGLMGSGIAEVVARAGHRVVVLEATAELCARGLATITRSLDKLAARTQLTAEERQATLARITVTVDAGLLAGCDLVIEAIVENQIGRAHV